MSEGLLSLRLGWRRSSFSRKFRLWLWLWLWEGLGDDFGLWLGNGCCFNKAVSRLVRGRRVREGLGFLEFIGVLLGCLCGL